MSKALERGRKKVPTIKRVRRASHIAWVAYTDSKTKAENWPRPKVKPGGRSIGKPTITPPQVAARDKKTLDEAINAQRAEEGKLGLKHLGKKGLAKWILQADKEGKPNNFIGSAGRPSACTVEKLHKQVRRFQTKIDKLKAEDKVAKIKARTSPGNDSSRGRPSLPLKDKINPIKQKIADLKVEIEAKCGELPEIERLKIDLNLARSVRRNIIAKINTGERDEWIEKKSETKDKEGVKAAAKFKKEPKAIMSTDKDSLAKQQAWLKSETPLAAQLNRELKKADKTIGDIQIKIDEINPSVPKKAKGRPKKENVLEAKLAAAEARIADLEDMFSAVLSQHKQQQLNTFLSAQATEVLDPSKVLEEHEELREAKIIKL